jgi:hypothetical protein
VASTLPRFSNGLKLVRLGIIVMLLQIVGTIVVTVMAATADGPDQARNALVYYKYLLLANVVAVGAMAFGVGRALPELKSARMDLRAMLISTAGFVVATVALAWTYYVMADFIDLLTDSLRRFDVTGDASGILGESDRFESASKRFESINTVVIIKDLAYGCGLYFLTRTVQASAALNDQLALRDRAGSMHRAVLVMVIADLFYQLTYAQAGGGGKGALLIAIYWIWCHVKLQRFLFDAAWFVNEPHNLPTATVVIRDTPKAAEVEPSQPVARPSQPSPIIVVPQPTAPTPRTQSTADGQPEGDGPRFLR